MIVCDVLLELTAVAGFCNTVAFNAVAATARLTYNAFPYARKLAAVKNDSKDVPSGL